MSIQPSCLENIIGLSQTTCECFENETAIDITTSKSGLYLDQTDGLNLDLVNSITDCEQGNIWQLMDDSREEAIKAFKSDFKSALFLKYKNRRQPFSGQIGESKFKQSLNLTGAYAGMEIFCDKIIGGTLTIKRIGIAFDSNSTFTVSVYDNLTDAVLTSYNVTSVANQVTWYTLSTPLVLDMSYSGYDYLRYFLVYTVSSAKPKDIKASCGCGANSYKYYWNLNNPRFFSNYQNHAWSQYIMLSGFQGNDISTWEKREALSTGEYLNGLLLDAEFKCNLNQLICIDEFDFETNELATIMAYAIRYKSAQLLVDKILASGQINRFTMADRERLMGKKNTYVKEYTSRIEYLGEKVNPKVNDCLMCDDADDLIKVGIFS